MYKIIGADQKEYGPITAAQLRQWIAEGRVNGNTKVLAEGAAVWKNASELPEFAGLLPVGAPAMVVAPIVMPGAQPKANPMAVWSMVTGIIGLLCCQFLGIVSLVLGIVAHSQIKQNPQQTGSGFATTGIVLGIISLILLIIGILVFIAFPQALKNFPTSFPQ